MNLIRIDHASLDVGDRDRSIRFYDTAQLGLFADRAPGLRHVALATDRAGQMRVAARLEALGVAFRPVRHAAHDSIYFDDPDGHVMEILVPTA